MHTLTPAHFFLSSLTHPFPISTESYDTNICGSHIQPFTDFSDHKSRYHVRHTNGKVKMNEEKTNLKLFLTLEESLKETEMLKGNAWK